MTYADGRVLYDADSHLMESLDWLSGFADEPTRDRLGAMSLGAGGGGAVQMIEAGERRRTDAEATIALEDNVIGAAKGWMALGAMDPTERTRALDLLGFQSQLVFSTFATAQFAFASDLDFVYGGTAAHNRGITAFCSEDSRLVPVGFVPLNDVDRALGSLDDALELGCGAVWVPYRTAGAISPAHVDLDPFWLGLRRPTCRSCSTLAAAAPRCRGHSTTTAVRCPRTTSAAAKTFGPRTSRPCTTPPRHSCHVSCSTASSSAIQHCGAV